jgi:N-acetylneuraminate synthase/N,N'-diacetyllegionaminate synthase
MSLEHKIKGDTSMKSNSKIKIGKRCIGDGEPCFIVAEIGCNHDGSLDKAKKMVDIAAEAGVDAVKFQSFSADKMFNADYDGYRKDWLEILRKVELPKEWHKLLNDYCKQKGVIFFSTICDEEKVDWLAEAGVPVFKVGSYEMNHLPLLKYAAKNKKPFIISTGIAVEKEIKETLDFLKEQGANDVAIFHCVSAYPGDIADLNLRTIPYYKEKFGIPVGLSDHCPSIYSSVLAVTMGANLVEKHITLDKSAKGPDHHFALDPAELKLWAREIRNAEKALGKIKKEPAPGEAVEVYWRRSLWPSRNLPKGSIIKEGDIVVLRPSPPGSLWPKEYFNIIGKETGETIKKGDNLTYNAKGEVVRNRNHVHQEKGVYVEK